jgi:acetyl esterase
MNRIFFLSLVFLITVVNLVVAQDFTTHVYKETVDSKLSLDVFLPIGKSSNKHSAIILFHGGALSAGQKEIMYDQCRFFSKMGMVAITPSYHLIPKNSVDLPLQVARCISDAKSALRWVKIHHAEFGIDTNLIVVGGGSAGGFLATEIALNEDINDITDDLKVSTKVKALVLYNPAYIPKTRYTPPPVQFISKKTPPAILFFGDKDTYKPGGDEFYNQLFQQKVKAEMWVAGGQKHSFYKQERWARATNAKSFNFLLDLGIVKGKRLPDYEDAVLNFQQPINQ